MCRVLLGVTVFGGRVEGVPGQRPAQLGDRGVDRELRDRGLHMRGCVPGHDGNLVQGELAIGELAHHRRQLPATASDRDNLVSVERGQSGAHGQPVLGGADAGDGPRLVGQGFGHGRDQP